MKSDLSGGEELDVSNLIGTEEATKTFRKAEKKRGSSISNPNNIFIQQFLYKVAQNLNTHIHPLQLRHLHRLIPKIYYDRFPFRIGYALCKLSSLPLNMN
jgi:hypothetical protein